MKQTPPEADSDEQRMLRLLACDVLLNTEAVEPRGIASGSPPSTEDDRQGRGRLMMLLRMLDAADAASELLGGEGGGAGAGEGASGGSLTLLDRFEIIEEVAPADLASWYGRGTGCSAARSRSRCRCPSGCWRPRMSAGSCRGLPAARLDHPGIVRVFDAGEIGPLGYFIASEFCGGPSLRRWLKAKSGAVSPRTAAQSTAALADAVQHAARAGDSPPRHQAG